MLKLVLVLLGALGLGGAVAAQGQAGAPSPDAARIAAIFGARPDIEDVSLSPDGLHLAYLKPTEGQGSALYVVGAEEGAKPSFVFQVGGKPERLANCHWVANDRIVCTVYGAVAGQTGVILPFSRIIAINSDGSNGQILSTKQNRSSDGSQLNGGRVIDWLPGENGSVLMLRNYIPDAELGLRGGSDKRGFAVDHIDTRTLAVRTVEPVDEDADEYISDGAGTVRIRGVEKSGVDGYSLSKRMYQYRLVGDRTWLPLSEVNIVSREGFDPVAIDHDRNIVFGRLKKDGRQAFYSVALDGSKREELVFDRPDVDVEHLIRLGRTNRVIGVSYVTDMARPVYFDQDIGKLSAALSRALPKQPIVSIADSDATEKKLLVYAGSDIDPGVYYLLDRTSHALRPFVEVRAAMDGLTLAPVKAIQYPAKDGTMIPAYLTLPPGKESAKGLPAIVLPHGGPSARDVWGFDWLSQYYAQRGFAVLQPNFRGSAGYGDAWFQKNGFKSWQVAIGDVTDAGRWLVAQGIADPGKLGIVGWSYGGYAALQSGVVAPDLFKAIVAIAPVTDLGTLREESSFFSNYALVSEVIGRGAHVQDGSPAQNAAKIHAPVLLFHGTLDRNVGIGQSRLMAQKLKAAGGKVEMVTWDGLDHYCDDSKVRTELLAKSDAFLRAALGI